MRNLFNRVKNRLQGRGGFGLPPTFNPDKGVLIDQAFTLCDPPPRSFADLGGVWGVDGAYTFYTLQKHRPERAFIADTSFTEPTRERKKAWDNLTLVRGNFGSPAVAEQIGQVDAVFLFDVLLHQVKPDWQDVLKLYAPNTNVFVIFNQQWTGSNETVRLIELGKEAYFKNVPHAETEPIYEHLFQKLDEPFRPGGDRLWRDLTSVWQWGMTDEVLTQVLTDLGFDLLWTRNFGRFGSLPNFENHAFVFQRRATAR